MEGETKRKKILITGVGGPAGINISRLFKDREDVEVLGCDSDDTASGQIFTDRFLVCPLATDGSYKNWTKDIVRSEKIDLLIPTVGEELLILARFIDELPTSVMVSSVETLQTLDDKLMAYNFVADNLPQYCPEFVSLSQWTESWTESESFFIKPRRGRGSRGCRIVSFGELAWIKENISNPEDYIVMANLIGTEWTVDAYVANNGSIAYLVPRERLALSGGISVKGRTIKNEEVIDATKLLLSKLPSKGPVCVQWKADSTGKPKFIEMNPRLSGGLMISVGAGIDPVGAILSDLNKEAVVYQDWKEVTVVGHTDYNFLR